MNKNKNKTFKTRKIVLGGVACNINSTAALNAFRDQMKQQKELDDEQKELQKDKNKFTKRVVTSKNSSNKYIKKNENVIIPDPDNVKKMNVISRTGDKQEENINVSKPKQFNVIPRGERKSNEIIERKSDEIIERKSNEIIEQEIVLDNYYTKKFNVQNNMWNVIILSIDDHHQNILKIFDNNKKQLMPPIKFPNKLFVSKENNNLINEYRIYFKTLNTSSSIDIYSVGSDIKSIRVQQVNADVMPKYIDLWKFRKLYDLEFIKYYMKNIKLECTSKFIDRFDADYELFKNSNYFDNFIKEIKISKTMGDSNNILYLIYSTIEYEQYGYTLRTHNLLNNFNKLPENDYKIYGVSRYGYPYDREQNYFINKPNEEYELDDVKYIKLLHDNDNFNNSNIIEYLKKYIIAVINLAVKYNAKIIHATTNYWNGIAALYAAKYLNIKCVYEIRGWWELGVIAYKTEIKDSDMIKMMVGLEKKILDDANYIITINDVLKNELVEKNYENVSVIYNCVDYNLLAPDDEIKLKLKKVHEISDEIIIGYIGTLSNFEGLDYMIECIKLLKDSYSIKFIIIGDGIIKNEILESIKNLKNNVHYLGKMSNDEAIKYYNLFDIVAYPRKNCELCNSTTSYKIFEAMSMALPIIVSKLKVLDEFIVDNKNALYCNPDDVNDLKDKIEYLINNPEIRKQIGLNARQYVISNRNWANNVMNLKNIYDHLLI